MVGSASNMRSQVDAGHGETSSVGVVPRRAARYTRESVPGDTLACVMRCLSPARAGLSFGSAQQWPEFPPVAMLPES